jgi:hypothetical protein
MEHIKITNEDQIKEGKVIYNPNDEVTVYYRVNGLESFPIVALVHVLETGELAKIVDNSASSQRYLVESYLSKLASEIVSEGWVIKAT